MHDFNEQCSPALYLYYADNGRTSRPQQQTFHLQLYMFHDSGPALKSGVIQEGDILCEVDKVPVLGCTTKHVSNFLLGPKDTPITMVFLRGIEKIVVHLLRQHPCKLLTARNHVL
jgi:C-terminal processing protease CtpA/Prc